MTSFSRRVSFNNLFPDYIDPNEHENSSPFKNDFSLDLDAQRRRSKVDQYLGNVNSLYLNGTFNVLPQSPFAPKKKVKLPDPPLRSILKNRLLELQVNYNLEHSETINYHGDLNDMVDNPSGGPAATETAVLDDEDDDQNPSGSGKSLDVPPAPRRKLYLGMTDEELMALDPQFNTSKLKNLDMFKFDLQQTYYLPSSRRSSALAAPTSTSAQTYPTSNADNYKLISLTVNVNDGLRDELSASSLEPDMNRTLLSVISGRRHSWCALDWLSKLEFLLPGDHLVIAAVVPAKIILDASKRSRKRLITSVYNPDTEAVPYRRCARLLDYVVELLPASIPVKVTVEFVLDNTMDPLPTAKRLTGSKFMFLKVFQRYQPQLVVLGTKQTSLNFKYPLKSRLKSVSSQGLGGKLRRGLVTPIVKPPISVGKETNLVKVGSYLIKYAPAPVILVGSTNNILSTVPAGPGSERSSVDTKNKDKIDSNGSNSSNGSNIPISQSNPSTTLSVNDSGTANERKNLAVSLGYSSLIELDVDTGVVEYKPSPVIAEKAQNTALLADQISELYLKNDQDIFLQMLTAVSDSLLKELREYLEVVLKSGSRPLISFDTSNSASRVHLIFSLSKVSSRSDEPIYKVKLMILYEDDEKPKRIQRVKLGASAALSDDKSNTTAGPKKKGSFWKKIGLKK